MPKRLAAKISAGEFMTHTDEDFEKDWRLVLVTMKEEPSKENFELYNGLISWTDVAKNLRKRGVTDAKDES